MLNPLENPEPAWLYKKEYLADGLQEIVSRGVRTENSNLAKNAGLTALKVVDLISGNPAAKLIQRLQNYAIYCPNTPTLRGTVQDAQSRPPLGLSANRSTLRPDRAIRH